MKEIKSLDEMSNELTLVDFFATWCGPCKMLAPVLEKVSEKYNVLKVDVDQAEELAYKFNISSVPTLILFKDKKQIAYRVGYASYDELIKWIENNI